MRISYEWLSEMVDLPGGPARLVDELTRTGTEVEAVEQTGTVFKDVVTAQIIKKEAHPASDHLWVCTVDVGERNVGADGTPQPLQIVCGAQNFNAGDHVATALVGAVLPGDIRIKKSKLRGVESCGMNCSERELGLGDDHTGIMILPPDTPIGLDFSEWRGLSDTVLVCEMTPNRPDCLSMTGCAVEASAIFDVPTHIELPAIKQEQGTPAADLVDIDIADTRMCSRYCARVVRNVKIGPSPDWLARRIIASGGRPINNVVDVTNYVMFLTGQPLHAFDLGKLDALPERGGKRHIVVRAAHPGEELVTLDHNLRVLTPDMCVITDDGGRAVALAGVMGGLNSDIDENTKDVLLESAMFAPGHISRTSRALDLMSEASIRFERGVDACNCLSVADVAAALFESCCGAEVCPGVVDCYPVAVKPPVIDLRPSRVNLLAGADIPVDFMAKRLERLGCTVEDGGDAEAAHGSPQLLRVSAPTNRPDLTREADLAEEIIRLWGEDIIEPTIPAAKNHTGGLSPLQKLERKIGASLRASGLSETMTYCFADADELSRLGIPETGRGIPVEILNPLKGGESSVRRSLLGGLLRSVSYNFDHGVGDVCLYEIGRVFFASPHKSAADEPLYVAGVMAGRRADEWSSKFLPYDFFDMKGVLENLFEALRMVKIRWRVPGAGDYPYLVPGRSAEILAGGEAIGWVGNVHPRTLEAVGLGGEVVAFELKMASLERLATDELPFKDIPTLPAVALDLAVVVDESLSSEQLIQRVRSAGGKLLEEVRLFDIYRDPLRVGPGKKSVALSLTFRDAARTLSMDEALAARERIVQKIARSCGAEVRG